MLANINDTQLALIARLANYKKGWNATKAELNRLTNPKKIHSNKEGWLLSRDITDKLISREHRSMYLKKLSSMGLIEREELNWERKVKKRLVIKGDLKFYNRTVKYGKKPWLIYRLKRKESIPFEIFKLFYEKGKIWELMGSDYFNDTLGEEFRFWFLKYLMEKRNLLSRGRNKAVVSRFAKKYYKLVYKGLAIPPSMMYYFVKGNSLPISDTLNLSEIILSFMIQDYINCKDEVWKERLLSALKILKQDLE